ncbi:aldehyde dehydrogenase family protein [Amycolatopsis jejuensis]|uniref:aldehyde dehydrogenase family protein n=1 Tax=Amycolatopsis jejuensis TaxID=330084 RepID=UPI00068C111B|nr:aldehyde dehydrogenase family protein [Amycolatopsis jejuensis]
MNNEAIRIVSPRGALSGRDVRRTCAGIADHLHGLGLRPGDRVALVAANSVDYVLTLLTLMHLDVSLILLDDQQATDERARVLHRASARWLICDPAVQAGDTPVRRVELGELAGAEGTDTFVPDLERWWAREDALIVFSSGTTGEPTAVVRSGPGLRGNIERTQRRMNYTGGDVLLPLLPFSHQYGLSLLMLWWSAECCLVVVPHTRLDAAVEAITEMNVTVVDGAPSTYHSLLRLLENRSVRRDALESVRMWCVGGAPLGSSLPSRFTRFTGKPLLDGYGSSEAGNIALSSTEFPKLCGRPLDGIEIDIVDEDGRPVPDGEIGELIVRTPDLMVATLDEHGEVRPAEGPEHRTADIGYRTPRGDIAVLGRKGAVHRHGYTLYPEALAAKAEAAGAPVKVIDVPDDRRGSHLVFVVSDESCKDARAWRRALRPHLATHEQPNQVLVVPAFPLGRTGKIDMKALRELVEAEFSPSGDTLSRKRPDESVVPFAERVPALLATERYLNEHRAEILSILTEVSNHQTAAGELDTAIETLRGAVEEISTYRPSQVRQTAVFMPSNIPLYAYVLYLLIPSLFSESVVFRPSSHIRSALGRLHERLSAVHGLPIELSASTQREFVSGPVAESDLVVFTGTYANAEKIRTRLTDPQLFVYFGQGINPLVVGPGADVDLAARDAVDIRLLNSGQDCFGPDVIFVHESLSEQFHALLAKRIDELKFGPNDDPDADYGPMYYEQAFGYALEYLHNNATHIVHGGHADLGLRRLEPTVLSRAAAGVKANCEELFAPIFNVLRYSDTTELHTLLGSPFFEERAMGAMVYGDLPETVELLAKRHEVCLNTTLLQTENGNAPMGGRGIIANYVSYGGRRTAEPLLVSKAVADYLEQGAEQRETA